MEPLTSKDTIRAVLLQKRQCITLSESHKAAAAILEAIIAAHFVPPAAILAVYHPLQGEINANPLTEYFRSHGHVCCLPVTCFGVRALAFREFMPDTPLTKDRRGVPSPPEGREAIPGIIFVPMVGFDKRGYRLGHGGGHYDTTLDVLRDHCDVLAVGLAYDFQEVDELPIEIHDQRMDIIVTPTRVLRFE